MNNDSFGLTPIGWVRSSLKNIGDCPHWQDMGPEAEIEILAEYAPGLDGMQPGQKITLLTWLHLASRSTLHRDKYREPDEPVRGVFSSRSPARPNPIGQHEVTVVAVERGDGPARLRINALEALDGTPVLDIKTKREFFFGEDQAAVRHGSDLLLTLCRRAAARGLLPGCSGNASLRLGSCVVITPGGLPKEVLQADDIAMLRLHDGQTASDGAAPSSERGVHLEIYRRQPKAGVILHTHPASLMALGVRLSGISMEDRLNLPVFECGVLREKIGTAPAFAPGTSELAVAAGEVAAAGKQIVWLEKHGLCVWGPGVDEVLALSEECEHLARVALLAL